jgi:hypothetical protein
MDFGVKKVPKAPPIGNNLRKSLRPVKEVVVCPRPFDVSKDGINSTRTKTVPRLLELVFCGMGTSPVCVVFFQTTIMVLEMIPTLQGHVLVARVDDFEGVGFSDLGDGSKAKPGAPRPGCLDHLFLGRTIENVRTALDWKLFEGF